MDYIRKYFEYKLSFISKEEVFIGINGSQLENVLLFADEKINNLLLQLEKMKNLLVYLNQAKEQDENNSNFWIFEQKTLENFEDFLRINLAQFEDIYQKLFNIYLIS